jgi:glycine/D-amino acid oxidase-like deaminating enzyme
MEKATFSIWEQEAYLSPRDIIIVGGGLVGLWSAWFLKQSRPDLDIAIVERGQMPMGASTRNAGFACFGSPGEILEDYKTMGRDQALELVEMRYKGLKILRRHFPPALINFEACGGYECFSTGKQYEEVMSGLEGLNKDLADITGYKPVFSPSDSSMEDLGLDGFDHLLFNPLEGALHSGLLVRALTQMVLSMGVSIFTDTKITGWDESSTGINVQTDRGFSLHAAQILWCTNGFAAELIKGLDLSPARGQVLVTEPIAGLSLKGTFHFDQGFYYFRHLGDRILLGGARNLAVEAETSTELQTTDTIQQALEGFLQSHVTQARNVSISHRWAGIMAMGKEKKPIIEALSPRVFCAIRMSGVGVAISPLVGQKAADLITRTN